MSRRIPCCLVTLAIITTVAPDAIGQAHHPTFSSFVADEALFLSETRTLRGRQQVAAGWKPFFDGPQAPFSWEPERVEVLDSGTLALSSGPVRDPQGKRIGTFSSIWRLDFDGAWRVIFYKGCPPCGQ